MKIAVISDTHNNLNNLKSLLGFLEKEKIEILIHCGDVAGKEPLDFILDNFKGKVWVALGNMDKGYFSQADVEELEKEKRIKIFPFWGELEIKDKKIAFVHFPEKARDLALSGKYDIVFYGHTHKPWEERIGKCLLLNPGNLAGLFYPPTFAVYDFEREKTELIFLDKIKNNYL